MSKRDEIAERYPDVLFADGFDDAILGVSYQCGRGFVVCYDIDSCVELLMTRYDMSYENAGDYLDFNVIEAYVGEYTPVFITRFE
jgi:hypothetical protein